MMLAVSALPFLLADGSWFAGKKKGERGVGGVGTVSSKGFESSGMGFEGEETALNPTPYTLNPKP